MDWLSPLVDYTISQGFRPPSNPSHAGIDMAAPDGTPILVPRDGVVVYVSPNEQYGGNVTNINHEWQGRTIQTRYDHQTEFDVVVGQTVTQGQLIGTVGHGGEGVTGPHLHYEWHDPIGTPCDPTPYLGVIAPIPPPLPPKEELDMLALGLTVTGTGGGIYVYMDKTMIGCADANDLGNILNGAKAAGYGTASIAITKGTFTNWQASLKG